jgi:hypothetical protein
MSCDQNTVRDWLPLIQAEYLEMPGLKLTRPQVQRLWALDPDVCDALLEALVASDFLKVTRQHAYVLSDGAAHKAA